MASTSFTSFPLFLTTASFLILVTLSTASTTPLIISFVNHCNFYLWPAIQPDTGHPILARSGTSLSPHSQLSVPVPTRHWSGRVWVRTHCALSNNIVPCATDNCSDRANCGIAGAGTSATRVHLSLHDAHNDVSSYGVSLVDGFNVPVTVTPHGGKGPCPVVGCRENLLAKCPSALQVRLAKRRGAVVACKSGCQAFRTDKLCCRNRYSTPQMCKPSVYSQFFKRACPNAFTFANDSPSLMQKCASPRELKLTFCHKP